MLLFGLITLLVGLLGLVLTSIFIVLALFKRNAKNWKRVGISFFGTTALIIILILIQEVFLYPPNPKIERLVLSAYREAPIGGYWLGLYNDSTWELGNSPREIEVFGTYTIIRDTLNLVASEGEIFYNGTTTNTFLINEKELIEIENSGIKWLSIGMNKLD